jgi:O-antigen/teichoic acid export membrane protein
LSATDVKVSEERAVASSALVTAAAQITIMTISGLLGLLILLKFGKNARTDGLFAAYGVYGFLTLLAQSLRTTVVPRLVEGDSLHANVDRFLGALLLIFALCAIPLVVLGGPLATLLTGNLGDSAHDAARTALAILWLSAGAQFVAALAAAALGVRGEFGFPAIAYVLGGAASIAGLFLLAGPIGIDAVATGAAAGSVLTAFLLLWRLGRRGYRPTLAGLREGVRARATHEPIFGGSAGYMIFYLTLVISLAFAARIGEGDVTLYSYAFFTALAVMSVSSGPAGLVLAAPLSQTWDRTLASLEPHLLAVFRTGIVVILPVIAVTVLIGDELIDLILGTKLTAADADTMVGTFAALSGMLVTSIASIVPLIAAFTLSRYLRVALISAACIGLHVGLSAVALQIGTLQALAGATSLSLVAWLCLLLALDYGAGLLGPLVLFTTELFRVAAIAAAAFVPLAVLALLLGGAAVEAAAAIVGLGLFAVLTRRKLPEHWELLMRLVRPLANVASLRAA